MIKKSLQTPISSEKRKINVMKDILTIVVPCYNEEKTLLPFYKEIKRIASQMKSVKFDILLIDDGSKDKTLDVIKKLTNKDKQIRYISFSRNFGKPQFSPA